MAEEDVGGGGGQPSHWWLNGEASCGTRLRYSAGTNSIGCNVRSSLV